MVRSLQLDQQLFENLCCFGGSETSTLTDGGGESLVVDEFSLGEDVQAVSVQAVGRLLVTLSPRARLAFFDFNLCEVYRLDLAATEV
jgi:hypothetical protein